MNEKPHTHTLTAKRPYPGGSLTLEYGDQIKAMWFARCHEPAAWRVRWVARAIVREHDRQSLRAGKRAEKRATRDEILRSVTSAWYEGSQQQMDDLHAQAIREDENRSYRASKLREVSAPSVFVDDRRYEEARRRAYLTDPMAHAIEFQRQLEEEKRRAVLEVRDHAGRIHQISNHGV